MAAAAPMIVAAVVSAVAASAAAYMQYRSSQAQANAMEANADIAAREAKNAVIAAQQDTLNLSRQRRKLLGRQAAMYGAAGVEMVGSPLEVMTDTAAAYEQDIMTRGYAGDMMMRSKAYESQLYNWQADVTRSQAKTALTVGIVSAAASGASSIYGAMSKAPSAPSPTANPGTSGATAFSAMQSAAQQSSDWGMFKTSALDDWWNNNRMRSLWAGSAY